METTTSGASGSKDEACVVNVVTEGHLTLKQMDDIMRGKLTLWVSRRMLMECSESGLEETREVCLSVLTSETDGDLWQLSLGETGFLRLLAEVMGERGWVTCIDDLWHDGVEAAEKEGLVTTKW